MIHPYIQTKSRKVSLERGKVTIGRHSESSIIIEDTQSSRNHCVVERVGRDYVIRDLDSRNGTRVNGQLVTSMVLAPNDVITIGQTSMTFVVPKEAVDHVEVLSSDDLVEVASEENDVVPYMPKDVDYEVGMEKLADALPDQVFTENDIEMINARGGVMHHGGVERSQRKGRREPVDLFRLLLLICFRSKASDIHVEPRLDCFQARLRIDGTMVDVMRVPNQLGIKLTALVKVLSDIDISHKNTIQEGHFATVVPAPRTKAGKRRVDYRVSFAPALHGQKLVIRILDPANAPARIADLQLPRWMYEEIGDAIKQDSGMILVSGPTGSGKTTSLYALVRSLETTRRNVVTIEDPVEIQIENVTQIPVDEAHDKSFSSLLRSVLRQDPDVLLVGEVRDAETARIAMQAAITGHLVFSTVHTKDTVGTIFRMLDLGVEPYLVAQGLHVVLAQRLARRLCPYCKKPVNPTSEQRTAMGDAGKDVVKIFAPRGCVKCLGTGFFGRQAFFELLVVKDELRDVILANPSMQDIQNAIYKGKFIKLQQAAYRLVAEGTSPFDEIERIVGRDR